MKQDNIRKVTRNGRGTYYVSIPRGLVKELRLKERQKVVVSKYGKGILIKDWKKE